MSTGFAQVERSDTVPLTLTVSKNGGVAGLTAVVEVRDGTTIDSYLDFDDGTFKVAGWVQKQASLVDLGGGVYALSGGLDLSAITNLPAATRHLFAEYAVSGAEAGVVHDVILLGVADIRLDELWRFRGLDSTAPVTHDRTGANAVISTTGITQTIVDGVPGAGDKTVTRA